MKNETIENQPIDRWNELSVAEDIAIDPQELEYEIMRQPSLYMKWTRILGEALDVRDHLKRDIEKLKRTIEKRRGALHIQVKKDPSVMGELANNKPTVDTITSWINADSQILDMEIEMDNLADRLIGAENRIFVFQSMQTALTHKKKSLEMIADMILSGYYTDPKISKEALIKAKEKQLADYNNSHQAQLTKTAEKRVIKRITQQGE